jgi:hypothetical protein
MRLVRFVSTPGASVSFGPWGLWWASWPEEVEQVLRGACLQPDYGTAAYAQPHSVSCLSDGDVNKKATKDVFGTA